MVNEQWITIRGRLTADPEIRFTQNGAAVANFTVAANARMFDKNTNEWRDKPATFWRCAAWRELGENVGESLSKGDAVLVLAELESRSFEDKDGNNRTVTEARVEAIGPDLRWATAKPQRAQRKISGGGFGGGQDTPAGSPGAWTPPAPNGWGTQPQGGTAGGEDEAPF